MVEVRQTTFAFDRTWPLGNVVFLKYRIYNRGAVSLDSAYVARWRDPDVGGPDDDLVACDSTCGWVTDTTPRTTTHRTVRVRRPWRSPCSKVPSFPRPAAPATRSGGNGLVG